MQLLSYAIFVLLLSFQFAFFSGFCFVLGVGWGGFEHVFCYTWSGLEF